MLDLGCAAGHLTHELVLAGADVIALDKSERMVAHARRLMNGRAHVEVADLSEPLHMIDNDSMDLVAASLVLHYLSDWQGIISEIHRVHRRELERRWRRDDRAPVAPAPFGCLHAAPGPRADH
ncbi:class I SAM-dependent methyltransferase [Nocardioides sp. WL0053]|uniref:Class I SAM-dependent methyltransferase n=1 Tax=Nocardioides jiangsuensis TaxID=2866161 RepID=A0ABS7RJT9_9ACTN|nr:class I SAM-dependent methyltransferase [Nocardioides jiangsuensis]